MATVERRDCQRPGTIALARNRRNAEGLPTITGLAAVFYDPTDAGTQYQLWHDLAERIGPTAFDRALKEGDDCRGLFNHDPNLVLGRTASGTLQLTKTKQGLQYSIEPPPTELGRQVVAGVERGDLSGSSFAFSVESVRYFVDAGMEIREVESVRLFDVGPVTYPAYEATTAEANGPKRVGPTAAGRGKGNPLALASILRADLRLIRSGLERLEDRCRSPKVKADRVQHRMAEIELDRQGPAFRESLRIVERKLNILAGMFPALAEA
jgi:HK97 family phage prohead protease